MENLSTTEKTMAALIVGWLICSPFLAGWFGGDAMLFMGAPFLLVFGVMALLSVGKCVQRFIMRRVQLTLS